jgi:hypothetical protein
LTLGFLASDHIAFNSFSLSLSLKVYDFDMGLRFILLVSYIIDLHSLVVRLQVFEYGVIFIFIIWLYIMFILFFIFVIFILKCNIYGSVF